MDDACTTIADQLGLLLQRRVRRTLTDEVVDGVHPDVDAGAYLVLSGVARYDSVSASVLGAEIGVDRALVSRRAARLVEAGLLQVDAQPTDRRARRLRLTAEGSAVIDRMRARLVSGIDRRLSGWTKSERAQFADRLTEFVASMSGEPESSVSAPAPSATGRRARAAARR